MRLLAAFLRLVRSLNLFFIAITQVLFQYFIVVPIFRARISSPAIPDKYFLLLCLSSLAIAAAGYVINDYFDLNIDRINKPSRIVVGKLIKRRWAILWHWILSLAGIFLGFYVGWKIGALWLGLANVGCVVALWFYSTTFKKKLLIGNVIISLLTAWVVMVVGFATHYRMVTNSGLFGTGYASKLLRFTFLYAGFAFVICLVREVIKDIEDMPGDLKYGCRTMPIVWGVHVSKVFAGTWLAMLAAALLVLLAYVLQLGWWISAVYCFLFVFIPLCYILKTLSTANSTADYHRLSGMIKLVMLSGIVSMIFL